MAHPSTARRRFGAALSALGIGVAAAAALVGMAGTAAAHVPDIKAECTDNGTVLQVHLERYDDSGVNTVKVMDGDTVLLDTKQFGRSFDQTFDNLDATVDHVFTADVRAHDDPNGSKGFTRVLTAEAKACVTPPPTTTTEVPPTSSEAPPVPPSSAPATTTPAAQPAPAPPLAETGASVALPLGIGAVLLVGGGVLLFVVRRRSRA
ncbi:MAG TPA: LPXTG cell wall anchor domain-containing protein [Actinophytocola sp.]|jgi:LPXTG-motif cell wall-anchored protein|uniref:LPXTG cell wall anchor domain-containing protein n=1 Tax=Actinophytocola sp. TaxID=1872138 RepID=UPI002F928165